MGGGKIKASNYSAKARGVAILFRRGLDIEVIVTIRDTQGRYTLTKIKVDALTVALLNLYAPNEDDPEFFDNIFSYTNDLNVDHFIIGGDFNKVLDPTYDRKSKTNIQFSQTVLAELINGFLEEVDWVDIWRHGHEAIKQFTWNRCNPLTFSRLDMFLIPYHQISFVLNCEIWYNNISDHSFVFLEMEFDKINRGQGLWKFSNSLLQDLEVVKEFNEHIFKLENEINTKDPSLKWEILKKRAN